MFDRTDLDGLIVYEDIHSIGYPVEAEDALAAWEHGDIYEPPWYMDLPESIRHEIESVNWKTQH